ncbi:MAG TPA: membrane protein insertion efficiency factor YidD [Candidatus Competibacter sp.]|nr:membrane protein insertion efficiency factor YidD [Candidatus Competibacter sp.]
MKGLDRFALAAISCYQRHLSPHKGFRCAHGVLHGGPSCSESARQAIAAVGFWRALPIVRAQLRACRAAATYLAHRRKDGEDRRKRRRNGALDCLPDACPIDACPDQCVPDSCVRLGGR